MFRNVPSKSNIPRRWSVLGDQQQQRFHGVGKINLLAKPRTRVGQKKLTRWEKVWRWSKSLGVLILLGIALFLAVYYSEKDHENSMENMERRVMRLRDRLANIHDHSHEENPAKSPSKNSINVVLLTHPWSGSGYVGDLLTLANDAAYFLEPSPFWTHSNQLKLKPHELLYGIFNCQRGVLRKLSTSRPFKIIRKLTPITPNATENTVRPWRETDATLTSRCSKSKLRIIETAKLKLSSIIPLTRDELLKVKIIHVVRDPQIPPDVTTVRSVTSNGVKEYKNSAEFQDELRHYCVNLSLDLESGQVLNRKQYMMLRQEDLRDDPMAVVRRAYSFLGISTWYTAARDYFRKHRNGRKWKLFDGKSRNPVRRVTDKDCKKAVKLLGLY